MAKKSKATKSNLPVLNRGDAAFRGISQYIPAKETPPARSKKPPSPLRTAVRQGVMTVGEAAETASLNRYYKKQGVKVKPFSPITQAKPVKSTGFSNNLKPYVPQKPVEVQLRSMTRSRNADMFSGVKTQDYDTFIKNLGKTSTGSKRMPLKVEAPKGTKRDLTFRYTAKDIAEKARSGKITNDRARSWALASTNRLATRASELAAQEAADAKAELKSQNARGVVRKEKAIERKKLYQSPETKRFREEKARNKSSSVIYAAEKRGRISLSGIEGQKFVRVSEEAFTLSKEAEKVALKTKVAGEGQKSFAEALKNVESGAKVEQRRKVTVKDLESALENAQKEATILERNNMPKAKVKVADKKAPAKKGNKAQLVKPKARLAPTAENLAKVLAGDAPTPAAVKPKAPTKGKAAPAPKAAVKAQEAKPKVKVKPAAAPAVAQEAPKVATKGKTPKAKAAPKAKAKPAAKPQAAPAATKAAPSAETLAAKGQARAAGVRQRAGAVALEKARGNMASRALESAKGAKNWRQRLFKMGASVLGSVVVGGGVGYMMGDGGETGTAPKPAPKKPKPAPQAGGQQKAAPVTQVMTETRAATKVAPKATTSGFGTAFKQARQARLSGKAGDTFEYGGKMYTSYQKGEQPKAKAPAVTKTSSYGEDSYKQHEAFRKEMKAGLVTAQPAMSAVQLEEQFKKKKGPR